MQKTTLFYEMLFTLSFFKCSVLFGSLLRCYVQLFSVLFRSTNSNPFRSVFFCQVLVRSFYARFMLCFAKFCSVMTCFACPVVLFCQDAFCSVLFLFCQVLFPFVLFCHVLFLYVVFSFSFLFCSISLFYFAICVPFSVLFCSVMFCSITLFSVSPIIKCRLSK